MMMQQIVAPPALPPSKMGFHLPTIRAAELPGMVSVHVRELFPDIPVPIHNYGQDLATIRRAAQNALAGVDMRRIAPNDSVNVLCSEHGFGMMGGAAYAEVLRTVKDVVEERTGCKNLRLAFSSGLSKIEGQEIMPQHGLDTYFGGRVVQFGPYDKGVEIETEIGTLYGIGAAYKARRIIHVHYDDPREVHFHRANGRALKAFAMSYARFETRGVFHNNFPTQSANLVPRMIYESPFVQEKFAFAASLTTSPAGVTGVEADNDLLAMDKRVAAKQLRYYGKLIRLFDEIDECVVIIDGHRWVWYGHAGGLTACNLFFGPTEHLDLDVRHAGLKPNPAVKAIVVNYMWKQATTLAGVPTISTQPSITRLFEMRGVQKPFYAAASLEAAMKIAYDVAKTDKVIIFDGTYGAINCSPAMAGFLIERAPAVSRLVDRELLPKWLRQRGLPLDDVHGSDALRSVEPLHE